MLVCSITGLNKKLSGGESYYCQPVRHNHYRHATDLPLRTWAILIDVAWNRANFKQLYSMSTRKTLSVTEIIDKELGIKMSYQCWTVGLLYC